MTPRTCGDAGGLNARGQPCGMNLPPDAPIGALCPMHDPAMDDEMQLRRLRGNQSRSRMEKTAAAAIEHGVPVKPQSLEEIAVYYADTIDAARRGLLDARVAREIFYGLRGQQSALEKRDLLREIATLRKELADARTETPKPVLGLHRGSHA